MLQWLSRFVGGSKAEKLNASKCFPLLPLKPDIAEYGRHVRFVPIATKVRRSKLRWRSPHRYQHAAQ